MPQRIFRFTMPSFLGGMSRALDLSGRIRTYDRPEMTPEQIDAEAIADDWFMVGEDLRHAMAVVVPAEEDE